MEIADLVKGWVEGWAVDSGVDLTEVFTEDCVYEDVALGLVHNGRAEVLEFQAGYRQVFPDLVVDDYSYFTDGTEVCLDWTMSGTQAADLPDLVSRGRRFSVRGLSRLVVTDGRFSRCTDFWDRNTIMVQLGG